MSEAFRPASKAVNRRLGRYKAAASLAVLLCGCQGRTDCRSVPTGTLARLPVGRPCALIGFAAGVGRGAGGLFGTSGMADSCGGASCGSCDSSCGGGLGGSSRRRRDACAGCAGFLSAAASAATTASAVLDRPQRPAVGSRRPVRDRRRDAYATDRRRDATYRSQAEHG